MPSDSEPVFGPQFGRDPQVTVTRWYVADGAVVAADQPLCELETEKAVVDLPAPVVGTLRHLVRAGDRVTSADEIARIDPTRIDPPP